jgi:hypothetical protein
MLALLRVSPKLTGFTSMNRQRFSILVAVLMLAAATAMAQGQIDGAVRLPGNDPAHGGPAVGATVTIYNMQTHDSAATTTDSTGHFAFAGVAAGMYEVVAALEGYLPAEGRVNVRDNHTAHLDLFLRPIPTGLGNVAGVVLIGREGGPAVGATVTIFQMRIGDSLIATTDADGHFAFASVPVGEYMGRAVLEGYGPAIFPFGVMDSRTTELRVILPGPPPPPPVTGSVTGLVMLADNTPAAGAEVRLNGGRNGDPHHGPCDFLHTMTGDDGTFTFPTVPIGQYEITAMARMHGFASAGIVVTEGQTTQVTLVLNDSTGGGPHRGDSLVVVDLNGIAIVVPGDSLHPRHVRYFLDVNGDGTPDYQLEFGPPWYEPPTVPPVGAHRPANGDTISIRGGLFTYTTPPMVVVYDINGLFWRRPFLGHGGHGGGDHHRNGCNPDSVTRIEAEGTALVQTAPGYHGARSMYALDTDANGTPNYFLDFGAPDYVPPSGATRPANGDAIAIVGGEVYCPNAMIPIVIVYEINGLVWREPGDTVGMGAEVVDAVNEPVSVGAPLSYVMARNFPNPFNPTTTIQYSIPVSGNVQLTVFDITGRQVATLVNTRQAAGSYAVSWDGSQAASGIYFYRLNVGDHTVTNRMVLMK